MFARIKTFGASFAGCPHIAFAMKPLTVTFQICSQGVRLTARGLVYAWGVMAETPNLADNTFAAAILGTLFGGGLGHASGQVDERFPANFPIWNPYAITGAMTGMVLVGSYVFLNNIKPTHYKRRKEKILQEEKKQPDWPLRVSSFTIFNNTGFKRNSDFGIEVRTKTPKFLKNTAFFVVNAYVNNLFQLGPMSRIIIGTLGMTYQALTPQQDVFFQHEWSGNMMRGSSCGSVTTNTFSAFLGGITAILVKFNADLKYAMAAIAVGTVGAVATLSDQYYEERDFILLEVNAELQHEAKILCLDPDRLKSQIIRDCLFNEGKIPDAVGELIYEYVPVTDEERAEVAISKKPTIF